ncbi:MAG TPA: S41 family peptidase [Candidatus Dojkabacteria bacterium]|nr:S41 family peptidase [Candidatus Dojkabacteria bacterium]
MEEHKKSSNIFGLALLLVAVFSLGIFFGRNVSEKDATGVFSKLGTSRNADMDIFWQVWNLTKQKYVDSGHLDEKEMVYGATRGLIESLDDVGSAFLDPKETKEFDEASQGKSFEGIGAELGYREKQVIVVTPIEGSPAKAAGIRPGDIILKVDDYSVASTDSVYDIVAKIRGEAGTEVKLSVLHSGDREPVEIKIKRSQITVPSMTVEFVGSKKDVAHFKVNRFTEETLGLWEKEWNKSVAKINEAKVEKVILDLRGNPGGFFDAAIYAGDDLLDEGFVISQQVDADGKIEKFESTKGGNLLSKKVVVLVDTGSASASEILAGALQQAKRAVVIGTKTFGKGTAQRIFDLTDGSSLHLTTLKWLLPDGKNINKDNSITPDIEVKLTNADFEKGADPQLDRALEEVNK